MSNSGSYCRRLVLVIKRPAEPSRHRMAIRRELRKIGVLSLGQGIRVAPDVPVCADGITRAIELTEQADGQAMTPNAFGRGPEDAARSADRTDFLAGSGKYEVEIAKEIRSAKFTLVEPEEEKQSLERLRRRHRDLTVRGVFAAPHKTPGDHR
ncbi:Chromate resistance protein ChrB [Streptomyces sp. NTH33]|uniref:Chromate resistance protein ChrB n=1 Tax=Streptomyces sp. NTH33 TaxID=1735453 RepID=UPI0021AD08EA|nr:Chromate resistance protein ChrB [Streptomyces sp. NTH33]